MRRTSPVERAQARRARRQAVAVAVAAVVCGLLMLAMAGRSGVRPPEPVGLMKVEHDRPAAPRAVVGVAPAPAVASAPLPAMPASASVTMPAPALLSAPAPRSAPAAQPAAAPRRTEQASPVTFDGRPLRKVKTLTMLVTAYSPDERSCGKWADGITASGYSVWTNGMKMVAADTRILSFGTLVSVPGYNDGKPVPVLDRGGKIKGHRLDLLYPTHEIARRWGARRLTVTVWDYAD